MKAIRNCKIRRLYSRLLREWALWKAEAVEVQPEQNGLKRRTTGAKRIGEVLAK